MRLIDADKLVEICDKGWRLGSAINTKIYHTVDASDIRSQPTVKAIPMGWISEYSRKPLSNADYWAIMRMVTAWEKENANDKTE